MELSPTTVGAVLIGAAVLSVIALAVSLFAMIGQRRVRRAYAVFSAGRREDVLTLLQRHIEEVSRLRGEVVGLREYADRLRELERRAISQVAMVRYDAFDDMGGHLSFSAALMDEHGDGLVVSAINGRTDTRVYAKPVQGGESRHNLSDEERSAIARALRSGDRDELAARAVESRRGQQPALEETADVGAAERS